MIDNIENKIESFHLQQCSLKNNLHVALKNRSLWKLVILLEAYFFNVTVFTYSIMDV